MEDAESGEGERGEQGWWEEGSWSATGSRGIEQEISRVTHCVSGRRCCRRDKVRGKLRDGSIVRLE